MKPSIVFVYKNRSDPAEVIYQFGFTKEELALLEEIILTAARTGDLTPESGILSEELLERITEYLG